MIIKQRTIKNEIRAMGIGVHRGEQVTLLIKPAPANTGIIFRRIDLDPIVEIPALAKWVGDTQLCTTLVKNGERIATVEHLMSALSGLGIDNIYVDVNASEIPIMDGSASPFVFLLQSAGIVELDTPKYFLKINKTIRASHEDKWAQIEPYNGFRVALSIDFEHPVLKNSGQSATLDFTSISYVKEISRARTFGFFSDYEWLRANNLALGGSLNNAVVVDDVGVMNSEGLRYRDEFVKHKILDAIGDLYMTGAPLLGSFKGYKIGHYINNKFVRKISASKDSWELVTMQENDIPIRFARPTYNVA